MPDFNSTDPERLLTDYVRARDAVAGNASATRPLNTAAILQKAKQSFRSEALDIETRLLNYRENRARTAAQAPPLHQVDVNQLLALVHKQCEPAPKVAKAQLRLQEWWKLFRFLRSPALISTLTLVVVCSTISAFFGQQIKSVFTAGAGALGGAADTRVADGANQAYRSRFGDFERERIDFERERVVAQPTPKVSTSPQESSSGQPVALVVSLAVLLVLACWVIHKVRKRKMKNSE